MTATAMPRGPVMADVNAFVLTEEEKQRLLDPSIGGVILFRRNFENVAQLKALVADIKALRSPELVVAVDHEGGRVQRFIDGFTRLPAMAVLFQAWEYIFRPGVGSSALRIAPPSESTMYSVCGSFTP